MPERLSILLCQVCRPMALTESVRKPCAEEQCLRCVNEHVFTFGFSVKLLLPCCPAFLYERCELSPVARLCARLSGPKTGRNG